MADLTAGALLGLSLGNAWICALVVFALRTADRAACGGYLAGRFLGVLGFVFAFWLLGGLWQPPHRLLNLASGVVLLLFLVYYVLTYRFGWRPFARAAGHGAATHHGASAADHGACTHDCASCPVHGDAALSGYCSDCGDTEKSCSAEDIQVSALTRAARRKWGRPAAGEELAGFGSGFALGALRGSAMCGRLIVLLPLVLSGSLPHALGVGAAFALTSTIYPVLGMLLGGVVLRAVPHRKLVFDASAVLLFATAGVYLYRGVAPGLH
jgi:hypothetical protein